MIETNAPPQQYILDTILRSGEGFKSNKDRLQAILDIHAPVFAKLVVQTPPPGFPPAQIRQQWVGLELPLRAKPYPDGIPLLAFEAIDCLKKAGRTEAVKWWEDYYILQGQEQCPEIDPEGYPEFLVGVSGLEFDPDCGEVTLLRWGTN
ncbi:MAG TPA: hypothetical protein VHC21_01495 [Candidatus Saccharimonadales bacterium]|nr:hypothetical protein [Candidatus Saccharimonadales bacterium]